MNILIAMPIKDFHLEWIKNVCSAEDTVVFHTAPAEVTDAEWAEAQIIFGNPPIDKLHLANKLRLLQINSAGTGAYLALPGIQPQAVLCCATGSYGLAISEHMLGVLLMMMKKLALYRDRQFKGVWGSLGFVDSIEGSNAMVIGMGDIGSSFAKRLNALGAYVTGIRRSGGEKPDFVEAVYTTEEVDRLLPQMDIVAMCMPETPQTKGFMNAERFALMKKGAYLVNIGRGSAVDQDALLEALRSEKLAGAALDVTTPEPLPSDHPLWQEPHCVITPHISGGYQLPETLNKIVRLACRNITALKEGRPLESIVDFNTGYRHR